MYSALIVPEYYSNDKIKELIELYRAYNKDMSPVIYTPEQVERAKAALALIRSIIDSKVLGDDDEDESYPVVLLTNKVVAIIKDQTNPLTDQEWIVMFAILKRINS